MSFQNLSSQVQNQDLKNENLPQKLIDLLLTCGDDGGQDQLINIKIEKKHQELLKEIQSKEQVNNDTLLVFKFEVQTGRQRESFQFIEKGLDQDENNENTSAMQKLFHRPKTTGRIQLKEGKGFIYVIYRFYAEKIQSHLEDIMKIMDANIDFTLYLEAMLKGTSEPSKRSFTAVKPDYFQLKLQSQKLTITDFLNFLEETGQVTEEQKSFEFYKLLKNLQIATFDLKLNSIRQIMRYYNRIIYENDQGANENDDFRELPLLNKGIFKNFASAKVILANKLAIQVEAKYKSQQVMLRLIARFFRMYETI